MRNPARIPEILELLQKLWTKHPDQRLGQLLANYVFLRPHCSFGQEDSETLKVLEKLLEREAS